MYNGYLYVYDTISAREKTYQNTEGQATILVHFYVRRNIFSIMSANSMPNIV